MFLSNVILAKNNINNVTFEKASIESFSSPDAAFDVILGLSILHLVEDRDAVLEKVFRSLKPGGVFISSTACMGDNLAFFKYIVPVGRALGVFPVLNVFKEAQLVSEVNSAGFTVLQQWRPKKSMAAFIVAQRMATDADRHGEFFVVGQDTPSDTSVQFANELS